MMEIGIWNQWLPCQSDFGQENRTDGQKERMRSQRGRERYR
jgi:hypothetical protein